jgi:hypothetical protein
MIVTCVEAGYLESQTIRMIESLRNWGGKLAQLPVVAVTPRFGPPIAAETRRRYDQLNVTYIRSKASSKYAWYNFMNKPASVLAAERVNKVDTMIWLDADLLIVAEPVDLLLKDDEDFSACPTEKNVATTGPDDPYQSYWIAMCEAVGIPLDDVPWMNEFRSNQRIRMYYNGGVISYRPSSGYAGAYLETTERILDAKIKLPKDGIFYHEQAAVGLAVVKQKVRRRNLSESCNYHFGSMTQEHVVPEKLRAACVLHYHRSMQSDRWKTFVPLVNAGHPHVTSWLEPKGPLNFHLPFWKQALGKVVRTTRKKKSDAYLAECRVV